MYFCHIVLVLCLYPECVTVRQGRKSEDLTYDKQKIPRKEIDTKIRGEGRKFTKNLKRKFASEDKKRSPLLFSTKLGANLFFGSFNS